MLLQIYYSHYNTSPADDKGDFFYKIKKKDEFL